MTTELLIDINSRSMDISYDFQREERDVNLHASVHLNTVTFSLKSGQTVDWLDEMSQSEIKDLEAEILDQELSKEPEWDLED